MHVDGEMLGESPQVVTTNYYEDLDDALEAVRAADLLGFGVRLRNEQQISDSDEEGFEVEVGWVVEVLDSPPTVEGLFDLGEVDREGPQDQE